MTLFAIKLDILGKEEVLSGIQRHACKTTANCLERLGVHCCVADINDMIWAAADGNVQDREDFRQGLHHIISDIKSFNGSVDEVHATIGIGGCCEIGSLRPLVARAEAACWDGLIFGTDNIYVFSPRHSAAVGRDLLDDNQRRRLKRSVETLDSQKILSAIHYVGQLVDDEARQSCGVQICNTWQFFLELLADVMRSLSFSAEDIEKISASSRQIRQCGSIQQMFCIAGETTQKFIAMVEENQKNLEKRPIRKAKQFIYDHYQKEVSLEEISQAVGLNPSYLSSIFKKETGQSIMDFLTEYRLEQAKNLLLHSELTISEVAWRVGYTDEKYFMRIFKKKLGLTCSEFCKLYG